MQIRLLISRNKILQRRLLFPVLDILFVPVLCILEGLMSLPYNFSYCIHFLGQIRSTSNRINLILISPFIKNISISIPPLYDALYQIMGAESFSKNMEKGLIEVAPLAYMRGRTLEPSAPGSWASPVSRLSCGRYSRSRSP